jgi:hypothetical protein
MESILIALLSAVVGAVLGGLISHRLTMKLFRIRAKSLLNGFYNELEISRNYLTSWLDDLLDEYRLPKRGSITELPSMDMSCINSLTMELIAAGTVLSKDHRRLILSLKTKYKSIQVSSQNRSDKSNFNDVSGVFNVKKQHTAHLVLEVVEIMFYLSQITKDRDAFTIESCEEWQNKPIQFLNMLGVKIENSEWEEIKRSRFENS